MVFAVACVLLSWSSGTAWSASGSPGEYDVKAALLSHFVTFVEWEPRSFTGGDGSFAVCVLGQDPFGSRLDKAFEGKTVARRKVTIHRSTSLRDLRTCHLLFVSDSEEKRVGAVLRELAGRNVLTVSDIDEFVDRGGMIQLKRSGKRVQFEINRRSTEQARLKVSDQLFNLASKVHTSRY